MKKLKLKSPGKQLATNLWNAYFMDTLEKKEGKEKEANREKRRKVNPK